MAKARTEKYASFATICFEAKLWLAADKLRNNMDGAEAKHVVLGLIFLKYISDTFEEHHAGANPEDPDKHKAENVFWVPAHARWSHLQANARPSLDKHLLGELIDLIGTIALVSPSPHPSSRGRKREESELPSNSERGVGGMSRPTHRSAYLLGSVYEYFLSRFASAEGNNGFRFCTPSCVVSCLAEILAPRKGRMHDPACGSVGMLVQLEKFVESHGGKSRFNFEKSVNFSLN